MLMSHIFLAAKHVIMDQVVGQQVIIFQLLRSELIR
jgi:hypothetical protein